MASVCEICGKKPSFGMNVSHSHRRTKRRWNPNIQRVRALINAQSTPEGKRTVGAEYGYSLTEAEANAGVILDAKDQAAMMKAQAATMQQGDQAGMAPMQQPTPIGAQPK